jgi:hypothetical protein
MHWSCSFNEMPRGRLVPPREPTGRRMSDLGAASPFGEVGAASDRDRSGRFARGNKAALVTGERSSQFWHAAEATRRETRDAVVADAGHTPEDAPRALVVVADGLAQAALLRDSAYLRVIESGGPLTSGGRTRRAFVVWTQAADRCERYARLVGVHRVPRPAPSIAEYLASRAERADASLPNEPEASR